MAYEKKSFVFYKWYCEDSDSYKNILTPDQMGRLFWAIMDFVKTEEKQTFNDDPVLNALYQMQIIKVDGARKAYSKKVEKLTENGKKGGEQKAINKAAEAEKGAKPEAKETEEKAITPAFKPSSNNLKNLKDHLKQFCDIEFTDYEFDKFLSELQSNGWKFNDAPICSLDDLEELTSIWFYSNNNHFENRDKFEFTFKMFCKVSTNKGIPLKEIFELWESFLALKYNDSSETIYAWTIGDTTYTTSYNDIPRAIKAYYEEDEDES